MVTGGSALNQETTQAVSEVIDKASQSNPGNITAIVLFSVLLFFALLCITGILIRHRHDKNNDSAISPHGDTAADNALTKRSTVSVILVACSGYMNGRMFTFKRELIIGRDSSVCTVVYPQKVSDISGTHCRLYVESGGVFLADLNSAAGTYLENGDSIAPNFPVRLSAGEKFYVGSPENMFEVRL